MTRLRLVQFWTTAETNDNLRLDSEIFVLRKRVWERAVEQARVDAMNYRLRMAGMVLLIGSALIGYICVLAR